MPNLFDTQGRPKQPSPVEDTLHRLVGGAITENGVQWSPEVVTVNADTDYVAFALELNDGEHSGAIIELEFVLTLALKAGSVNADPQYKWQARSVGAPTWVDLHAFITKTDIGTAYVECTVSGFRVLGVANLDSYPFEIQLLIRSNEAAEGVATARVKNTSSVKVKVR